MWLKEQKIFWKPICRKSKTYAAVGILLLCSLLAGCGKASKEKVKKAANEENSGWKPLKITKDEKRKAENQVKDVVSVYHGIFPYETQKPITEKDREKILKNLWEKGYPAADSEEKYVMGCSQKVRDFSNKVEQKKKGNMTMVSINPSGGFSLIHLKSEQKKCFGVLATVIWNAKGEASISELVKYQMKKLQLSEDGFFICEFYLSDQDELQAGGTMKFRLKSND